MPRRESLPSQRRGCRHHLGDPRNDGNPRCCSTRRRRRWICRYSTVCPEQRRRHRSCARNRLCARESNRQLSGLPQDRTGHKRPRMPTRGPRRRGRREDVLTTPPSRLPTSSTGLLLVQNAGEVDRSATACWGTLGGANTVPLVISDCEFVEPSAGTMITLYLDDPKPEGRCWTSPEVSASSPRTAVRSRSAPTERFSASKAGAACKRRSIA